MKKMSKNLSLLIVLSVLILLAWIYQGPLKRWQAEQGKPKNPLAKMQIEKINRIESAYNGSTTVLVKKGDTWLVDSGDKVKFAATKSVIESMTDLLPDAAKADFELASTNKSKLADYQLDGGKQMIKLKLSDGKNTAEFNVGRLTANYQGNYIGLPGKDESYRFPSIDLRAVFERMDWRELAIFNHDGKQADYLRLQKGKNQLVLEKKGEDWFNGKQKYKKTEVDKLAAKMLHLTAITVPTQDFKPAGLDKPELIIQIKGQDVDDTLMIGKATKDKLYYVKSADADNLYLISKFDHDELTIAFDRLK